ncbi:unnamed protein product [Rangifer tarandus platyrhynchus]|uniref:Uncharacterized protein n=1 Tax=Rangifer tarandus platyrhynchus TaxID=3082113 RepID=A0AC59YIW7_RANTA
MPKSCRESRPEDHTTLTFEGAPSFPAARGQHSPGAVPTRPHPLPQGGCGRKFLAGLNPPSLSRTAQTSHPTRSPEMSPAQPREPTLRSRPVSRARRAASTSANRSSLGASLPRVPLREEVRAPVNAPAGRDGGGGATRAAREDPRRAEAEQTPGGGKRRAPGMRISRHWGRGAGRGPWATEQVLTGVWRRQF